MADSDGSWEDAGAVRAGYERLRAAVLSGETGGWRLGHGVLCARGMAGWMNAFGELAPPTPAGNAPADRPGPLPDADQVVAVLAQMTLAIAA